MNTDRYGRIVGEVFDGETSLNLEMLRAGQVAVFARYCSERAYYRARCARCRVGYPEQEAGAAASLAVSGEVRAVLACARKRLRSCDHGSRD